MDYFSKKIFSKKLAPALGFAIFSALCGAALVLFVDITPQLEEDFFFSSDAPQLQTERKISALFPRWPQVILSAAGDIRAKDYLKEVSSLTVELKRVPGVQSVSSLGEGPASVEDALKGPLWSRLLIPKDKSGSNLFAFLYQEGDHARSVRTIEALVRKYDAPHFRISISGVPYVTHQIQTRLIEEIQIFSIAAFGLFATIVLFLYRSIWILIGSTLSCATSCFLTFITLELLGVEPGVLTANLWSIVFVLTLSHVVFITANWENLLSSGATREQALSGSLQITGPASLWAMITTLLGFMTLLMTVAKPIRQFGLACSIGTTISIAIAYLMYPAYLHLARTNPSSRLAFERFVRRSVSHPNRLAPFLVLFLIAISIPGISGIETDPNLFSYFAPGSEIRDGLEKIDQQGGTSPLEVVIQDARGETLNTDAAYERLWMLQRELENEPLVGSAISLPLIMGQVKQSFLGRLFAWDILLLLMDSPLFGEIGKGFITSDRKLGLYFLRMQESKLNEPREAVVARVEAAIRRNGFEPVLTGGLFRLQGKLSELVSKSLLQGLAGLVILFSAIALLITRSFRRAAVLIASLFTVPVVILGLIGYFRYPIDIISAPGFNIAVAIGIDDMIHLTYRVRSEGLAWDRARRELWKPVLASTLIVSTGFATFGLSDYPPTRRLGLIVAAGSIMAVFISLYVMPTLSRMWPFLKTPDYNERPPSERDRLAG